MAKKTVSWESRSSSRSKALTGLMSLYNNFNRIISKIKTA